MHYFLLLIAAAFASCTMGATSGVVVFGVSTNSIVAQTSGNQTNTTELARFVAQLGGEPYDTDAASLQGHADTARDSWSYTLTAGDWESDGGNCEPVGATTVGDEYNVRNAATDIFAMALNGYIDSDNTYYAAARTRILEFAAMTDFELTDLSGGNQCILDMGTAAYHVIEAAFLLENAGYSSWTSSDRNTLTTWATQEVFPVVSWGIVTRKNNWGIVTYGSALAIATYANGNASSMTLYDASTVSPSTYLSQASATLATWLNTTEQLDSTCQGAGEVYGLQSHGGFPDELRRTTGTTNCGQTSIAFDCTTSTSCGSAHFYQQKSTNAWARVCEIMRRQGDTGTCFDWASHSGNDEGLLDAAQFATGGDFATYYINDFSQGFRYVAGQYYQNYGLITALDDGSVSVRGGRDYAYTKITHGQGVAYSTAVPAP